MLALGLRHFLTRQHLTYHLSHSTTSHRTSSHPAVSHQTFSHQRQFLTRHFLTHDNISPWHFLTVTVSHQTFSHYDIFSPVIFSPMTISISKNDEINKSIATWGYQQKPRILWSDRICILTSWAFRVLLTTFTWRALHQWEAIVQWDSFKPFMRC